MTWAVISGADGNHIVPGRDLRPHVAREDCWCRPVSGENGFLHKSMDDRELIESGERKMS